MQKIIIIPNRKRIVKKVSDSDLLTLVKILGDDCTIINFLEDQYPVLHKLEEKKNEKSRKKRYGSKSSKKN